MKAFIEMKNSNSYFLTKHRSGGTRKTDPINKVIRPLKQS